MRGEIRNRKRARQLRDFTGLRFGTITPTDIDGFLEFRDRLFVWIETKFRGQEMPDGQRLALERQCDAVAETGRAAAVLVVEHDAQPEKDIAVAECPVREYRYEQRWHEPIMPVTCRQAIVRLLERAGILM